MVLYPRACFFFFFYSYGDHRDLHSFPTRRSSDLTDERFDAALEAVADFIDLKSPYFLGHARGVADVAGAAAERLAMSADEVIALRRAGLVLGFGRLGISHSIWDKRGPLGPGEWERVRMHPYLTERMLGQSPSLAPLGSIAVQFRERLDGS